MARTTDFIPTNFVREDECGEYYETLAALREQLAPVGLLENELTEEILSATWRLRRCRTVETRLPDTGAESEAAEKSLDRARHHAQNCLRRCFAELRKLQTERATRELIDAHLPGLADSAKVLAAVKTNESINAKSAKDNEIPHPNDTAAMDAWISNRLALNSKPSASSFCKITEPDSGPDTLDTEVAA
jgi:hypothetical protein